jgi:hypothetical protein
MAIALCIWLGALAAYALFLAWHENWRGKLSPAEIDDIMEKITALHALEKEGNDPKIIRAFLEADDGREFFMLNIIRLSQGDVAAPLTGEMLPARKVMEGYTKKFLPAVFARGGYPAIAARRVGGYFDAWGVEADPGWTMMGYMRYRSRRDLAQLVSHPSFSGAHEFKYAAMPQTFNFPTQPIMRSLMGPRVWVGLMIALVAALGQIAALVSIGV